MVQRGSEIRAALDACEAAWSSAPQLLVACSGGLDSTALLIALAEYAAERGCAHKLAALHVNHGLHAQADAWQQHCVLLCESLGVPLSCHRVAVAVAGKGLEAAAREARYAVFTAALAPGGCLLLGHHQDDQVETFFLRLLRGAGADGLAGMPTRRPLGAGSLLRPFLALPRSALQRFLQERSVDWIDDPSNDDTGLDRNFLRAQVLPLIAERWPSYRQPVTRAMAHLAAAAEAADAVLLPEVHNAFGDPGLPSAYLLNMPRETAAIRLRSWLRRHRADAVGSARLFEYLRQLAEAAPTAAPRLESAAWTLQRHGDAIYLTPRPIAPGDLTGRSVSPGAALAIRGVGTVRVDAVPGDGTHAPATGRTSADSMGDDLRLAFRRGGERVRLPGRDHSHSLKQLLQAHCVPPWWRERLPLLYAGDSVVAIGDVWRDPAAPWQLVWQRDNLRYVD